MSLFSGFFYYLHFFSWYHTFFFFYIFCVCLVRVGFISLFHVIREILISY